MKLFSRTKDEPDATLTANDAERWIAGTYAMWSEYCGSSYKYLGGYEKNKSNAKMIQENYHSWENISKPILLELQEALILRKQLLLNRPIRSSRRTRTVRFIWHGIQSYDN